MNRSIFFHVTAIVLAAASGAFANDLKTTGRYGEAAKNLIDALSSAGLTGDGHAGTIEFGTRDLECDLQRGNLGSASCKSGDFEVTGAEAVRIARSLDGFSVTTDDAMGGRYAYEVREVVCKIHNNYPIARKYGCELTFTDNH